MADSEDTVDAAPDETNHALDEARAQNSATIALIKGESVRVLGKCDIIDPNVTYEASILPGKIAD